MPLAVYSDACPYRAAAIEALVNAGRRWRIACESASREGMSIALSPGLRSAPLSRPVAASAGLCEATGLRHLPDAHFALTSAPKIRPVAAAFTDDLRRCAFIRAFETA